MNLFKKYFMPMFLFKENEGTGGGETPPTPPVTDGGDGEAPVVATPPDGTENDADVKPDEQLPSTVQTRFNEYAEKVRTKDTELENLKTQLAEKDALLQSRTGVGGNEDIKGVIQTLKTDSNGNVEYKGEWMHPDYAEQTIRNDMLQARVDKLEGAIRDKDVQQTSKQMLDSFNQQITTDRNELYPKLQDRAQISFIDELIGREVVKLATNDKGEFDPQLGFTKIKEAATAVRSMLGVFGNAQIQKNNDTPPLGANIPDGKVALPGNKRIDQMNHQEKEAFLEAKAKELMAQGANG